MGVCFSKCRPHKTRVTRVRAFSSPTRSMYVNARVSPGRKPPSNTDGALRRPCWITTADQWETKDGRRRRFRNRRRNLISPLHNHDGAMETMVESFANQVRQAGGPSQRSDLEAKPGKTVNGNVRTLKLLRDRNRVTDQLEIVEVISEEDESLTDKFWKATFCQDVIDGVDGLSRPMTAHQKRLDEKYSREVAAFESIVEGMGPSHAGRAPKEEEGNLKILEGKGPKVKIINVRPKTPECLKIEVVHPPAKDPGLSWKKDKEQMVPKLSLIPPLNKRKRDANKTQPRTFAEETASESTDSDDAVMSVAVRTREACGPVQHFPGSSGEKQPIKIYPYTKGRTIPHLPYPEDSLWLTPLEPTCKKIQPKQRDYEEFSSRLLNPSQKARATEGKILDGTLITWPKYLKPEDQDVRMIITGGARKTKMAWDAEVSQNASSARSPVPVPYESTRVSSSCYRQIMNDVTNIKQPPSSGAVKSFTKKDDGTVKEPESHLCDQGQTKRFAYKPSPLFSRRDKPFFLEKKLSFSSPPQADTSEEEDDFVVTPGNLRRYNSRRRAKQPPRPKTPFEAPVVPNEPRDNHQIEAKPQSVPASCTEAEDQCSKPLHQPHVSTCEKAGKKYVTFVIPLEGAKTKVRPPSSRPNTRRQLRPMTPRANAGELALRQVNAQRRREEVMRSRARGLGKRHHHRKKCQKEAERTKAKELMDKVERKMTKHGENRKKQLESIVAKHAEHNERVQHKHDIVYTRRRFLGMEQDASAVTSAKFTINDLLEIDQFFAELEN